MIEEVFHVDDAEDVIEIAVAEGEAGVGALLDDAEHFVDGLFEGEEIDFGAGRHDLADFELIKIEGASDKVAGSGGDGAGTDCLGDDGSQLVFGVRERVIAADGEADAGPGEEAVGEPVEGIGRGVKQIGKYD